jgi:hypothetical protein
MQSLIDEFSSFGERLSKALSDYGSLTADRQKSIRHALYKSEGGFGRLFKPLMPNCSGTVVDYDEKVLPLLVAELRIMFRTYDAYCDADKRVIRKVVGLDSVFALHDSFSMLEEQVTR